MKKNYYWAVLVAVVIGLGLYVSAPTANATHDGDLVCADCHIMHGGAYGQTAGDQGGPLLKNWGTDTDIRKGSNNNCMGCHNGDDADAPDLTSATYANMGGSLANVTTGGSGSNNGHDFVATGYMTDVAGAPIGDGSTNTNLTTSQFRCASCHDPHLNWVTGDADGNRLLRAGDDMPSLTGASTAVPTAAFIKISPVSSGPTAPSADNHTVYQSGMSEWCANCHTGLDTTGTDEHHPAGDAVGDLDAGNGYNTNYGTDYFWTVPFEDPDFVATDHDAKTDWGATGSSQTSTVDSQTMCLTCHVVHGGVASGSYIGRWDISGGQSSTWDGTAGTCNSCHGK